MGNKHSRDGGKFTGNHTTLTPAASIVADVANACDHVYKITPGFIKAGLQPANGQRRVKIARDGGQILLSIRDNTSLQEVHVFANDTQAASLAIARGSRDRGLRICFGATS